MNPWPLFAFTLFAGATWLMMFSALKADIEDHGGCVTRVGYGVAIAFGVVIFLCGMFSQKLMYQIDEPAKTYWRCPQLKRSSS